jgi:hypothetical protein
MQTRFALAISHGLGPTEAARVVGYAHPSIAGARLGQDPRIRAIIRDRRNRRIDKLASLSLRELELILRDRKVSAAVRFNAVKLSLALAGHVEPKAPEIDEGDAKRVSEMTIDELDAFVAQEMAKRAAAAMPVVDAESIEPATGIVPDDAATAGTGGPYLGPGGCQADRARAGYMVTRQSRKIFETSLAFEPLSTYFRPQT